MPGARRGRTRSGPLLPPASPRWFRLVPPRVRWSRPAAWPHSASATPPPAVPTPLSGGGWKEAGGRAELPHRVCGSLCSLSESYNKRNPGKLSGKSEKASGAGMLPPPGGGWYRPPARPNPEAGGAHGHGGRDRRRGRPRDRHRHRHRDRERGGRSRRGAGRCRGCSLHGHAAARPARRGCG